MIFLLYSETNKNTIATNFGKSEYSYFFVREGFESTLRSLGEVRHISDPYKEVDRQYEQALEIGEHCVFLCFAPPNKTPRNLKCPTVCVFAWEFDTIPHAELGVTASEDWADALRDFGHAISLSSHTQKVVQETLGQDYHIDAIPVPMSTPSLIGLTFEPSQSRCLMVEGSLIDSLDYHLDDEHCYPNDPLNMLYTPIWKGQNIELSFVTDAKNQALMAGFYGTETWGTWTRLSQAWVLLPYTVYGDVELQLDFVAYGETIGRTIEVSLGKNSQTVLIDSAENRVRMIFKLYEPANTLVFSNLIATSVDHGHDNRTMALGLTSLSVKPYYGELANISCLTQSLSQAKQPLPLPFFDGDEVLSLSFPMSEATNIMLLGFHGEEEWGVWSADTEPKIVLPNLLTGKITVIFSLVPYAHNIGRHIYVTIGDITQTIQFEPHLGGEPQQFELTYQLTEASNMIRFSGVRTSSIDPASEFDIRDLRSIGIGLQGFEIKKDIPKTKITPKALTLTGVVYTCVLTPKCGRKNWRDIVTAFCYAFRNNDNATLLIKMVAHNKSEYFNDLHVLLTQLQPFECRIVALDGFLQSDDYQKMVAHTDFYVSAARAEGLCLPLMEFMHRGKPAITPCHTAMLDYVNDKGCFVIGSSKELVSWPHDESEIYNATWHRIKWVDLYDAYQQSYQMIIDKPKHYQNKACAAADSVDQFVSQKHVQNKLKQFLLRIQAENEVA